MAEPVPVPAATLLEVDGPPVAVERSLSRIRPFGWALAGKGIGFLVLPILARLLALDQFGQLDVLNALVSSSLSIVMLGTDVAAVRLYFDRRTTPTNAARSPRGAPSPRRRAAVPTVGIVVGSEAISSFLFGSADLALAVVFVGIALLAGILHFVTLGVLRATGRPITYAALEGGALIANAMLAIALLVVWRADATSVMLALALSWSVAAILGLVIVRDSIAARSSTAARAILALALPLAPAIAATWVPTSSTGRICSAWRAPRKSVPVGRDQDRVRRDAGRGAAAQLAWHPHAYRLGVPSNAAARLHAEGRRIIVALVVCVGTLGLLTPELLVVIHGDRHHAAAPKVGFFPISVLGVGLFTVGSLPSAIARWTADMGAAVMAGVAATSRPTSLSPRRWARRAPQARMPLASS